MACLACLIEPVIVNVLYWASTARIIGRDQRFRVTRLRPRVTVVKFEVQLA
jgi:hypothetical protein